MNPFWTIVKDTARQSRQQVVYIIMLVLLAAQAIMFVSCTGKTTDANGVEHVQLSFNDDPEVVKTIEDMWLVTNVQIRVARGDAQFDPGSEEDMKRMAEELKTSAEVDAQGTSPLRRGVEVVMFIYSGVCFTLSVLLFLAACAGYFPNMLESGGVDIVLAKPISRLQVYMAKYVGGLALYSVAVAAAYTIVFVGLGIRTGVWHGGMFLALPLQIFSTAVLFAIVAALGVITRNSTLCLIVGLVFYIVVDKIAAALVAANRQHLFKDMPTMSTVAEFIEATFPNFELLKTNASAAVLSFPSMEAKPLLVAFAWMLGSLALGYWRFQRTDY